MLKFINLVIFLPLLSGCGQSEQVAPSYASSTEAFLDQSSLDRDTLDCLRGIDCTGFQVGNRSISSIASETDSATLNLNETFQDPFQKMWDTYPSGSADEVKSLIGGKVDADWIQNTCVVRVSRSFNYSGLPVPKGHAGLLTVTGADKKNYALRVREFAKYMIATYGRPSVHVESNDAYEKKEAVSQKKGVIMFNVSGWQDATGHFDLWNGDEIKGSEYFKKSKEVFLWQ